MDFWYGFVRNVIRVYTTCFLHFQVTGQNRIPDGPKIIVGNHPCATDGLALPFIFKEKLHFVIQADIFDLPIVGRLLTLAGQIPVEFGQGRQMLIAAAKWLELGHNIVIFPEGRLNWGKDFHRAGSGAALLALQTGMPVLPLGIWSPPEYVRPLRGNIARRPTEGNWQVGGKLFINIGEPLLLPQPPDVSRLHRYLRECTAQIMQSISDLVQQVRS